jgi:hypothetical protein
MVSKGIDVFDYGRHILVTGSLGYPLHHHRMNAHADNADFAIVLLLFGCLRSQQFADQNKGLLPHGNQFTLHDFLYLHDVIEDTQEGSEITLDQAQSVFPDDVAGDVLANNGQITAAHLLSVFSDVVVDAVVAMTKTKEMDYEIYLKQVKANPIALAVKLADIEDNVSRLGQLTDQVTKERLTKKYQQAMDALGK